MIPSSQPSILVIEDDDALRNNLVDMLELNDYRVESAPNGLEGLAIANHNPPALIVTDIQMPVMNGHELIRQLRRDDTLRSIPVIMISAKTDRASIRKGMELGADDFITKPFSEDEVIRSIRMRLEKKELIDELDAFAHTVAHDLKNPLATLNLHLELLAMNLGSDAQPALVAHVTEAHSASNRLVSIINELLVLAGVRRQQIIPAILDMGAVVNESLADLENLLKSTDAVVGKPKAWPQALGYQPWVVHVWSNYISNAAKYAGPKARITLGAEPRPDVGAIRFWVRDQGPGLDAAAQAALFVPFTKSSSIRLSGHGLGLSIVRRIIEKLHGNVGVESRAGEGARFWFELPVAPNPSSIPPFAP